MGALIRAAADFEPVRVNVRNTAEEVEARRHIGKCDSVEFFPIDTDEPWCRDHGPIFLVNDRTGEVAVADFEFNSWGRKLPRWELDRRVPEAIARQLGLRHLVCPAVLEGGSIDVNGTGSLLTTRSCLLHPNRNPSMTEAQIEENLRQWLGVRNVLWLGDGIEGDDTDGHIDDLTRFVGKSRVVTVVDDNPADQNTAILAENLEALRSLRDEDGSALDIVTLPMPRKRREWQGHRLPCSYANFLILNGGVLVPSFDDPRDAEAARIIGSVFPGRKVVPVECADLIIGLGSIHCLSQQQPAPPRA